jgi:penicillin-binding protein 1C
VKRRLARALAGALLAFALFLRLVPVVQFDEPLSRVLLDRDGALLSATIAADGQWRFGAADAIPGKFVTALTLYEDRRFFGHPGVDPLALARALGQNLGRREVVSGGSTLTMQVVRLSRKGRPRSLAEKLVEAVLALRLERALSKREILRLYAAYAPFGGNTVGLDAAAWRYFGREPERLSWSETAMLAVLPNAPSLIHPGRNRARLLAKRNRLLDKLHAAGAIDALTLALAKQEQLPPAPLPLPALAPHLLARVQATAGTPRWRSGDASAWLRSTLRVDLQRRATEVVSRHQRVLSENGVHNAAALVLDVASGEALAYVGNSGNADAQPPRGQQVDVIPALRSTGSVLKPLLFAAMLDAGEVLPRQLVADVPTHFGAFHPENFDRSYAGAVPAELALARSLNVPAVRMLRSYGVGRFYSLLRRAGLRSLSRPAEEYGLALILGGAESSLWEITSVYASLARGVNEFGSRDAVAFGPATYLRAAPDRRRPPAADAPLGAAASYLTLEAMLEVERPGEDAAWRTFARSRKVAWKTGTSYGFRDAWAVGVTPKYAVGVWAGNASGEGRPGLTGYAAAAPILFELFGLLPGDEWFEAPEADLRDIDVCAGSGMRAGPYCERRRGELVPAAALNAPACSHCRLLHTDASGRFRVNADCEAVAAIRPVSWFVLPPAMEWYYRRRHSDYRPLPPLRSDCRDGPRQSASLSWVSPPEGAHLYVPVEMGGTLGRIVFEAAHREAGTSVFWHLDDAYVGETRDIHQLALAPAPGRHLLTLVDEAGEMVRRSFSVVSRANIRGN